jgi:hypothetical protein
VGKKSNFATSQQWHNVEDKPTDFVPRWVKKNNLNKIIKLATQPSLYGRSGVNNKKLKQKIKI